MSGKLQRAFASLAILISAAAAAHAQGVQVTVRPAARVTAKVDTSLTSRLAGTHPAIVEQAQVGSRLAASTRLEHMKLLLSSSDEQQAALRTLADEQQDKTSPNFHKWLTPETFGTYFGAAQADIVKVTAWLQDQGFTVERVAKGNRVIVFSGTSGQIENAFQTEMHTLQVKGETHISNTVDVAVPTALSAVVKGVASLNNFFPTSGANDPHKISADNNIPADSLVRAPDAPLFGSSPTGTHLVAPGDAATIYNTTPLLTAGVDGTGQTVSVLARSNITLSDVQTFRSLFGLKKNDPTITVVDNDPGQNTDDVEAYLDAEWAGAMAPGAAVNFLVSSASLVSGGTDTSGLYAVENNIGDIITLSYGGCETNFGASGTAFWNDLWEQAAAQGQTVFVSSGDSGPAGCDSSSNSYAHYGYGVNALGSSAYNVAVGGSMFVDYGPAQYWGSTSAIPYASALSYIPESPWNQSRLATTYLNSAATAPVAGSGIVGAGGGVSIYTGRPSWQTGSGISSTADPAGIAPGSPITGLHRLVPDLVNIAASGHDGTLFCFEAVCSINTSGTLGFYSYVGGTSVATPVQASIQALINQKNGGRQGNANYYFYKLAQNQYTASTTACQAPLASATNTTTTLPAASCNFHDIVNGDIMVPTAATGTASIGFSAGVGYDEASGLGSMNVANVASNWSSVTFAGTKTSFSISPATGIAHGAKQTINVTVAPTSASGTPTGDVSLIAQTNAPNGPFQYTLTNGNFTGLVSSSAAAFTTGSDNGTVVSLPAGSYSVHAHYAGDGTFAPSDSPSVPVTIGSEASITYANPYLVTSAGSVTYTTSFTYGAEVYIDTGVYGNSGAGTATGVVTYALTRNGAAMPSLKTTLDSYGSTFLIAGQSIPNFYLKANYPVLTPGSYVLTASYAGDNNFASSTTSTSFVITALAPSITLTGPTQITSGQNARLGILVANPATAALPNTTAPATGTIAFTDTTTGIVLGYANLSATASLAASASLNTTAISTSGAHTISAAYSGDGNYSPATATLSLTVGTLTAPTLTVTNPGSAYVNGTASLTATLSTIGATGTVSFFDGAVLLGTATVSATSGAATLSYTAFTAGMHNITASYSGSTSYAAATGTLTVTISQNLPSIVISYPLNSTYGQTVALAIRLSRSPSTTPVPSVAPTGLVNFYDGTTLIGTGGLIFQPSISAYLAAFNTSTLTPGNHNLSATYLGDANFAGASSTNSPPLFVAPLTPPLVLTSQSTVYSPGALIGLTATLGIPTTLAAPTASVNFYDGTTLIGAVTPIYSAAAGAYIAQFTATGLGGGPHHLQATYVGDTIYSPAMATLTITIETNNVWIVNGNGTVSALTNSGAPLISGAVGPTGTGSAIAIDGSGFIWSANRSANSVARFTNMGTVVSSGYTAGGVNAPAALAFDGAGLLWIANGNNTLSVLTPAGTAASPTAYKSLLNLPTSINVDGSGNVWVTNAGNNTVTEVIGAATPVTTPQTIAVTNNSLASKP